MAQAFELDSFIEDCKEARRADPTHKAMREVVQRAVSDPNAVMKGLGEPTRAGVSTLYHAPDLTVLNLVWGPKMMIMPHNHGIWAVIGIYTGREDNIFWKRVAGSKDGHVEAVGAKTLGETDTEPLGHNIIHSVINPLNRLTAAIHVYGGDFFGEHRSEWDPETLTEEPYSFERARKLFEDSNAGLAKSA
ncbi:MAG: hypothetical protein ACK5JT_16410 [Hyphomicrobiaceae bacterium]